ncbi:hypothetical protein FIBSPDRAFT_938213 [Athelia psychrophila]|uniref:Uncharacterized protein n=1 Tax=Athelia psychrophila TaxID=1759441 RepID=A0A165YXZ3_9AGAM|nr:hypothetical protein FIBSPDRAFT_938213 [Fibularhizoctonia sp. CBS 109695]
MHVHYDPFHQNSSAVLSTSRARSRLFARSRCRIPGQHREYTIPFFRLAPLRMALLLVLLHCTFKGPVSASPVSFQPFAASSFAIAARIFPLSRATSISPAIFFGRPARGMRYRGGCTSCFATSHASMYPPSISRQLPNEIIVGTERRMAILQRRIPMRQACARFDLACRAMLAGETGLSLRRVDGGDYPLHVCHGGGCACPAWDAPLDCRRRHLARSPVLMHQVGVVLDPVMSDDDGEREKGEK